MKPDTPRVDPQTQSVKDLAKKALTKLEKEEITNEEDQKEAEELAEAEIKKG